MKRKNVLKKLKARQNSFDAIRNQKAFKRPGSMNKHKQG